VRTGQKANFAADRADFFQFAAVDAVAVFED
jgi:hypothetical protein